jgi:hypothetical protein
MNASHAIGLLSQLNYFPTNPEAVRYILDTLATVTEDFRETVVTGLLHEHDQWPGPATFYAACRAANGITPTGIEDWNGRKVVRCQTCQDTTFLPSYWLITRSAGYTQKKRLPDLLAYETLKKLLRTNPTGQELLTASEPCPCKAPPPSDPEPPKRRSRALQKVSESYIPDS